MKRVQSITLNGAGSRQQLTRGNLDIGKGKLLKAMRLKLTVPINNTTGGAVVLSDAQKQVLFGLFSAWVSYGKDGYLKPIDGLDFARLHRLMRLAFGSELEGYTDATTGLSKSLPNAATTNVVFYLPIPLGYLWMFEPTDARLLGMGRTQAKSLQVEIQETGVAIAANLVVSGNVSIEMYPQTESCKGDPWGAVPFWRQNDTSNDEIEGPEGLPLYIAERTAVHASSALTSINVSVDQESIHEAVNPQDTITEYNDLALATAAGSLVDRETVLYVVGPQPGGNLVDLPSGKPRIKQVVKNLATFLAGYYYLPIITSDDVKSALAFATSVRGKELKATSLISVRGSRAPQRAQSYMGFILLDRDDREWEMFPGQVMAPGESEPRLTIPDTLRDRAQAQISAHAGNDETKVAADVVKQVAASVPGSVPGARGFSRGGSDVLNRVSTLFKR